MSLAVLATVFFLVALAELPDKTMIATVIMGSRSRPVLVWAGAAAGFVLQAALAVAAGRLIELLPHRVVEIVVTVLFLAGAVYLLAVPEKGAVEAGKDEAESAEAPLEAGRAGRAGALKVMATAFGVVAVGEFGDLTQLLIVNLAARFHQPVTVFVGATGGLLATSALGAFGGRSLLRFLSLQTIRRVGGLALLGFGAYGIYSLVR